MLSPFFQSLLLLFVLSPEMAKRQQGGHYPALSVFAVNIAKDVELFESSNCHIRWLTPTKHDFGPLEQGKPVRIVFRFQNEGTEPVILQTARTTCGCTAAQWTETPVQPGEEGELSIEYDAYRRGKFHKKIWVFFDCQKKPFYLYIHGRVKT